MQKKSILSDEARETRNKLVEANRLKRGKIRKRPCVEWVGIKFILMNISLGLDS
jgi:enhancing lycopene biosynthesis protein 2